MPTATERTQRAEHGLGIAGKPYYFYALRADGRFSFVVFLLSEVEGVGWPPDARGATPFDSGGMWFGRIATAPPLDQDGRRALFKTHDVPLVAWRSEFKTYIRTRYRAVADYIRGGTPDHAQSQRSGHAIVTDKPNEAPAWTWEVRVPHQLAARHLKLQAVCISEENRNSYLGWLWEDSPLSSSDRREIDGWLRRHAIVPSPSLSEVDRTAEWLVQEAA